MKKNKLGHLPNSWNISHLEFDDASPLPQVDTLPGVSAAVHTAGTARATHWQVLHALVFSAHTTVVFLNRDNMILKQVSTSHLLSFRRTLMTYKISLFQMQLNCDSSFNPLISSVANLLHLVYLCNSTATPASNQEQAIQY